MPDPQLQAAPRSDAPDWSQIDDELLCPLCSYNLRGLNEPRCPECGYRFEWPALLDPRRRKHPYLFEHHPERSLRSLIQTARGNLRPREFWASLHPHQPSNAARLLLYWFIGALAFGVLIAGACMGVHVVAYNASVKFDDMTFVNPWGGLVQGAAPLAPLEVAAQYIGSGELLADVAFWGVLPLTWPWLTFFSLMVFRTSMRRARVNAVHILRCVLYSLDLLVFSLFPAYAMVLLALCDTLHVYAVDVTMMIIGLLLPAVGLLFYRLTTAFRLYLRFDRPRATVLASQVIVVLLALNLLLYHTVGWMW